LGDARESQRDREPAQALYNLLSTVVQSWGGWNPRPEPLASLGDRWVAPTLRKPLAGHHHRASGSVRCGDYPAGGLGRGTTLTGGEIRRDGWGCEASLLDLRIEHDVLTFAQAVGDFRQVERGLAQFHVAALQAGFLDDETDGTPPGTGHGFGGDGEHILATG